MKEFEITYVVAGKTYSSEKDYHKVTVEVTDLQMSCNGKVATDIEMAMDSLKISDPHLYHYCIKGHVIIDSIKRVVKEFKIKSEG